MRLFLIGEEILENSALTEGLSLRLNASVSGNVSCHDYDTEVGNEVREATAIIVGLRFPDALDCIRWLRHEIPGARILALVRAKRPTDVVASREAGADWCVSRTRSPEFIAESIEFLCAGRTQFIPREFERLRAATLTKRQVQILQVLANGGSIAAAVENTSLSYHTVRVHLVSARQKLGVASTLAAVTFAIRHRVVRVGCADEDIPIW